ncbi:MAG: hypothetical protein HOP15_15365 [Planctomycetes bacterium]|nr:hypothetical protein [Planctomycetota bacterium]
MFGKEEPKHVTIRSGAQLDCLVCGGDLFFARKGQLNTAVASFFNLDWTNPSAVHWFLGSKDGD